MSPFAPAPTRKMKKQQKQKTKAMPQKAKSISLKKKANLRSSLDRSASGGGDDLEESISLLPPEGNESSDFFSSFKTKKSYH